MDQPVNACPELASIILAGGEGQRLRSLTASIWGTEMPKQFCQVLGPETLLEQTLSRVGLTIQPRRTVTVLTRAHQNFYASLVSETPRQQLAIQPESRGTTAAILYGLVKIAAIDSRATVAIFPSDHYFSDDLRLMHHVEIATRAARQMPNKLVLLGVSPGRPDISYGWIQPNTIVSNIESSPIYSVRGFCEKPPSQIAQYLQRSGALWNTLVIVAQLQALKGLFQSAKPDLHRTFDAISASMNTEREPDSVKKVYESLGSSDFSRDILVKSAANLATLPVRDLEWSDLGEPRRVFLLRRKLGLDIEQHETRGQQRLTFREVDGAASETAVRDQRRVLGTDGRGAKAATDCKYHDDGTKNSNTTAGSFISEISIFARPPSGSYHSRGPSILRACVRCVRNMTLLTWEPSTSYVYRA